MLISLQKPFLGGDGKYLFVWLKSIADEAAANVKSIILRDTPLPCLIKDSCYAFPLSSL